MKDGLGRVFEQMSNGEVPNWLDVMAALNDVTDLVTLTERPPEPSDIKTVCELNGHVCCD